MTEHPARPPPLLAQAHAHEDAQAQDEAQAHDDAHDDETHDERGRLGRELLGTLTIRR